MTTQLWWDVARSGGLLAWALLAASVLWGLALSSRIFGRRPRPAWLLDLHRYLGGLAVVFVGVHVGAIMIDSFVHFGPAETFIPFASSWNPGAVAWGIVAFYLVLAVELTSLARSRLPARIWRRFHYLSFGVFVFSTIHLLTAGTDSSNPVVLFPVIAVCGIAAFLTALRVAPSKRQPIEARAARNPTQPHTAEPPPTPAGAPTRGSTLDPPPRRRVAAAPPRVDPPPRRTPTLPVR
jgi:DMSO/TMAO reductase YedYZ heme-binding membrane subunit